MSDEIFHEINEELRQQKLRTFWKENGPWIIGGAITAVVMTAALSWWRGYEARRDMGETAQLSAALGKTDAAALEAYAAEAGKNHAFLAKLAQAQLLLSRGEKEKAAALYDAAAHMRVGAPWRDLAKLYAASARLDTGDVAALRAALDDLSQAKNPWRFSARELAALLDAREGKMKDAAEKLEALAADPDAPADIRSRAGTLRGVYAGEGG